MYHYYSDDMRNRFKIPLYVILILFATCSIVFISYFLYNNVSYASELLSDYPLSINYHTGEKINNLNYEDVKFSITNNGDADLLYKVNLLNVYSKKDCEYTLVSDDYTYSGDFKTGEITDSILIKAGETKNFTLNVLTESGNVFEAEIKVVKEVTEQMNFSQTILSNSNTIFDKSFSSLGKDTAISNEGLIASQDEVGSVYYFRGNIENNYVLFADMLWRIVKINSDSTVKLALDSELDVFEKYYDEEDNYEFISSNVYTSLTDWYELYLTYYDSLISETGYCNDFSISNSEKQIYGAYNRIVNSLGASFDCVDSEMNLKIGLLNADELVYAGATVSEINTDFYLYSEKNYYTMTSAVMNNNGYFPFVIKKGQITYNTLGNTYNAVKPVINIIKNTYVKGDGSLENPYIIGN